ncbi:hypothetical protein P691DRAFT_778632 [Macrolepiota fuliginosa MF-IS2]|uniref:S-adenosyl-L-methionine-dependent methyltransferase n=1 Tax=Macrolepiota fuliginosa MF-IS2 TaxID=1400762 RepID=A0A9P5X6R3_9AGAR|nr:hypothetical protein P691DRAFT_778632 [Macrolepiota fuliginosa MF-IS2]
MPTREEPDGCVDAPRVHAGFEAVVDADEEVFILYSELQKQISDGTSPRGLGHVDHRKNVLTIVIELEGGELPHDDLEHQAKSKKRRTKKKTKNETRRVEDKTIEVEIAQDTTALRSRKGDTGSVLWHASVDFARSVLQQAYLNSPISMFNFDKLRNQHIFELGAGTGILSLLLSPLCRRYTATDIPELMPLIQKNIAINFSPGSTISSPTIVTQPLDWISLKNTPLHRRRALFPVENLIDVLLIVDCIYHPSLLPPLIETIDFLATPGQTAVVVVSELRSEQVIREFLELWLAIPGWVIHRSPMDIFFGPYVVWMGRKEKEHSMQSQSMELSNTNGNATTVK